MLPGTVRGVYRQVTRTVYKLHGPPGTGKTTYLMAELQRLLRSGAVAPDRVGFVSFSRRAVEVAKGKAREIPECASAELPHFRTIHSTAYHMIGLTRTDVVGPEHLVEFGDLIGMPCTPSEQESGPWEGAVGGRVLSLIGLAAARGTTPEMEWNRLNPDLPLDLVTRTAAQYRRFKTTRGLWDFNDMIENAVGELEVDVLFVDEAQDTSQAQWRFLRGAAHHVQTVYLAGDDDQAVYAWSGADPIQLLKLAGQERVLPHSYRLPQSVKQLADRIAHAIRVRVPKTFSARPDQGSVQFVRELDHLNLQEGDSWLLMARSNYQLQQYREMAQRQGVVYSLPDGSWSWTLPSVRAAVAYESLRNGGTVGAKAVRDIASFSTLTQPTDRSREHFTWEQIFPASLRSHTWMEGLNQLPLADREYIRALRRSGESLSQPGRIRISTVHGAKGEEAQHCVLLADVSATVKRAAQVDPDAERRVQYVGITRARESLTVLQPRTVTFWDF